jgi:ribosome-binding protein aMBF1 (putative translation factor)
MEFGFPGRSFFNVAQNQSQQEIPAMEGTQKLNRIKDVLNAQGRKQSWLADQLGKSYVVVTRYCNNKTQPNIPTLVEIARILDVDVRELLERTK